MLQAPCICSDIARAKGSQEDNIRLIRGDGLWCSSIDTNQGITVDGTYLLIWYFQVGYREIFGAV